MGRSQSDNASSSSSISCSSIWVGLGCAHFASGEFVAMDSVCGTEVNWTVVYIEGIYSVEETRNNAFI